MKKKQWKAACRNAEDVANSQAHRLKEINAGISACWDALRADGCQQMGSLPEVLAGWLAKRKADVAGWVSTCDSWQARELTACQASDAARSEVERLTGVVARLKAEHSAAWATHHDPSPLPAGVPGEVSIAGVTKKVWIEKLKALGLAKYDSTEDLLDDLIEQNTALRADLHADCTDASAVDVAFMRREIASALASAVAAEREACAREAETIGSISIARAIRSRGAR